MYVIARYRDTNANLRTQLTRIIRRAGLAPWPRLFHNLRSSRQTELEERFPTHVVCRWLGNSPRIASKHYLQVREADFQKAAQNPAQQPVQDAAKTGNRLQAGDGEPADLQPLAASCAECGALQNEGMTPTGFEPVSRP